ncbi:restriction endonuclease subunit S [Snodgrassella alvi]|uniref:restriction endonuclease subunit S n=1 Tax=Snodgrassella alvi TaxID=1196083 RepID=UPI001C55726D|nr:restriction endonuclease subunit S [Snodgrassella alvi]
MLVLIFFRSVAIASMTGSSGRQRVQTDVVQNYIFKFPDYQEQKAIASVLSSLDDKIDLLHRQNKTLESMAEALFRQWFIENPQGSQDELPLKEFVDVIDNRGKTPPCFVASTAYPIIEVNALAQEGRNIDYSLIRKYVDKQTFNSWFRKHLEPFDVVVSTVGSIGVFAMFFGGNACIAQNVIGLRAKDKISNYYLYQWLLFHSDEIKELDIGSVQPSIKVPHLLSLPMKIPNEEKIIEFDNHLKTIVQKILNNCNAIIHLEKLRDTLLPKLMSGEVRVKYAKE